jgi:hypothetical protein
MRIEDALPCPDADEHDWNESNISCKGAVKEMECSWCAALARRYWWGWEIKTGLEHFADFEWPEDELGPAPPPPEVYRRERAALDLRRIPDLPGAEVYMGLVEYDPEEHDPDADYG